MADEEVDMDALQERLEVLKKRKDRLVNLRAEKLATLKSSKDALTRLKAEAEERGYSLKELPQVVAKLKRDLNAETVLFEEALEEIEDQLSKYDI